MSNKPNARKVGWTLHSIEYPYSDRRFSVRRDSVTWPDGIDRPYTYIESGPAVVVVPFTPNGEVKELKAVALEKEGTAEAKVMEMKYHAEADGIRDKAEAMKIFDAVGNEMLKATLVYTGEGYEFIRWTRTAYDEDGRPVKFFRPDFYLPDEDQGILLVQAVLPGNSTLEQTGAVM